MTLLVLIGSIWKLWTRHCGIQHTDKLFTPLAIERSSQTFFYFSCRIVVRSVENRLLYRLCENNVFGFNYYRYNDH